MTAPRNTDSTDNHDRSKDPGVPFIGISRHRIGVDGRGVTTLAVFYGCQLRCRYCLNPQCFGPDDKLPRYTPENLYIELLKDDIYFRATDGGVTFGGGEPCLQADFIVRFREICGNNWKINVETSLNVDQSLIKKLVGVVDEWIIDVKTDDPEKYLEYTGREMAPVINNLYYLVDEAGVDKDKVILRIPVIPGFVERERVESTRQRFVNYGFRRFDIFTYRTEPSAGQSDQPGDGKAKCQILRDIREEIASQTGYTDLPPHNCTHTGDCPGTCPRCESEAENLSNAIRHSANGPVKISEELMHRIDSTEATPGDSDSDGLSFDEPLCGNMRVEPPADEVYKKIFFKECPVAGLSFHLEKDDDLWLELDEGTEIALVRDRNNKFDSNAVAVTLADYYGGDPDDFDFDLILGYIPRTENAEIAALIDAGYADKFSARITTLKRYGSYSDRIRITIYVESLEPVKQRLDRLRLSYLDNEDFSAMVAELKEQGFATFRWGGFPLDEQNLPEAGDKIVMMHEDEEHVTLYLMHVLMTGEDCLKLGIDEDKIHAVDDCIQFALANVAGPVAVSLSDIDFLRYTCISDYSVYEYLTPDESNILMRMFGITTAITKQIL